MCALFGPRVGLHDVDLDVPAHVWAEPVRLNARLSKVPALSATVRLGALNETTATLQRLDTVSPTVASRPFAAPFATASARADLKVPVLGHPAKLPPLTTTARRLEGLVLDTRAHDVAALGEPAVRENTAFMRDRLVERRGVSARQLTDEQAAYWRKRMGDAKRVPLKLIDLVAVFPDVPITGDAPVSVTAGALAYRLPEGPVPLTTVVVAKHLTKGSLLIGRFARS